MWLAERLSSKGGQIGDLGTFEDGNRALRTPDAIGLSDHATVLTNRDDWTVERCERTLALATLDCPVVAIGQDGGVVREPDGIWRSEGSVTVFEGAKISDLAALAGKPLG